MKKERNWFVSAAVLILLLICMRLIGPYQKFVKWSSGIEHFIEVIIVIVAAVILIALTAIYVRQKNARRLLIFLILICTTIVGSSITQGAITKALAQAGVIAAVLIFILQTPILNIVAWLYLSASQIYKPGDRIKIGDYKGDVVNITPMHTRIREIGGDYLHSDHPSGRMVTFPNSMALQSPVSNYTRDFPFIWVELNYQLTYPTDLDWVKREIEKIVRKHVKHYDKELDKNFKSYIKRWNLPKDTSAIEFYIEPEGSWIEVRVAFPVPPKRQAELKSAIAHDIVYKFKKNPKKAGFPKGVSR